MLQLAARDQELGGVGVTSLEGSSLAKSMFVVGGQKQGLPGLYALPPLLKREL